MSRGLLSACSLDGGESGQCYPCFSRTETSERTESAGGGPGAAQTGASACRAGMRDGWTAGRKRRGPFKSKSLDTGANTAHVGL